MISLLLAILRLPFRIAKIGVTEHGLTPYLLFATSGVLFGLHWVSWHISLFLMVASVVWIVCDTSARRHAEILKAIRDSKA